MIGATAISLPLRPAPSSGGQSRAAVAAAVVIGAVIALGANQTPTGISAWDYCLSALTAALVIWAFGMSPQPFQLIVLAVGTFFGSGWAPVVGASGMVLLFVAIAVRDRLEPRARAALQLGAAASAGFVVANLRDGLRPAETGRFGFSAVLAFVLIVALVVGGRAQWPLRLRQVSVFAAGLTVLLVVLMAGLVGVAGRQAAVDLEIGRNATDLGVKAARDGDLEASATQLQLASAAMANADDDLRRWWTAPARLVPIMGQHLALGQDATSGASRLTGVAATSLGQVDLEQLKFRGGVVNLEPIAQAERPLADLASEVGVYADLLSERDSPWLVPPAQDGLGEVLSELLAFRPRLMTAANLARELPGMLGRDAPRRYLVLFATPSEARELGGIIGNVVELTADRGRLVISDQYKDLELNDQGPGELEDRGGYPARFLLNSPELFVQNWSGMPDLPQVTRAVADLYPSMGGKEIDGVIYADPHGIAALMALTGPVDILELGRSLTSDNVAEFLLVGQYLVLAGDERVDFLERIATTTFGRLVAADLPSPSALSELLGPPVREGHLSMATLDPVVNDVLADVSLLGSFPSAGLNDHLTVLHANGGGDKLDAFLHRSTSYNAVIDPDTGEMTGSVTVTLENRVEPEGLPDYVVGGKLPGLVRGTNIVHLSLYGPHQVASVLVDETRIDPELQAEFGHRRTLVFAVVAPGETVTVVYQLVGQLDLSAGVYQLMVAPQASVRPERYEIEVTIGDRVLRESGTVTQDTMFEVTLR